MPCPATPKPGCWRTSPSFEEASASTMRSRSAPAPPSRRSHRSWSAASCPSPRFRVADWAGTPRYRMLETIREFTAECLAARPRAARDLRRRHARHYLALAEAAEPNLSGVAQDAWMTRLKIEVDNLRAALNAASERPDGEILERLAVALTPYWLERSQWSECRYWLVAATRSPVLSRPRRARVLKPTLLPRDVGGGCRNGACVGGRVTRAPRGA